MRFPDSMDECVYFTRRKLGEKGQAVAWVLRQSCPKCKKALMGKPREKGKVKIRSTEYVCPECKYTVEKEEYEPTLTAAIQFTCPSCGKKGEKEISYQRKSIQGVQTLRVTCDCGENIDVTKKMKAPKKKGEPDLDDD
ncbi:MAG: hypothetical protein ABIH41_02760 [Nanoarchaeota archaeon]